MKKKKIIIVIFTIMIFVYSTNKAFALYVPKPIVDFPKLIILLEERFNRYTKDNDTKIVLLQAAEDINSIDIVSNIDQNGRRMDDVNYSFKFDTLVPGTWDTVDFVEKVYNFDPTKKSWPSELYVKNIVFNNVGTVVFTTTPATGAAAKAASGTGYATTVYSATTGSALTWTKGLILLNGGEYRTASRYSIANINGSTYMFMEWKSGDYTDKRLAKPYYYVLKKGVTSSGQLKVN